MPDRQPPRQPPALSPAGHAARRTYFASLLRLGFTLLKLHRLDEHEGCTCGPWSGTRLKTEAARRQYRRDGVVQPCGNPGKHPIRSAKQSVVSDVEAVEAHLDEGGSIGLCLRIKGLPTAPIHLLIWDCDREGAYEWLRSRGITSDLEVYGKRGQHVLALMPRDVPALRSDTSSLNPGKNQPTTPDRPGIDIKVSGLVVTPYSPNKRLYYQGRDISESPDAVSALFATMDALKSVLPLIDPREVVPCMREAEPDQVEVEEGSGSEVDSPAKGGKAALPKRRTLSQERPVGEEVRGFLKGVSYHHRKRMALNFLRKTLAVDSRHDANTFRVICTLLKRYFLSEEDCLSLLRKHYAPRVADASGALKPPEDADLIRLIIRVSEGSYLDPIPTTEDPQEIAALKTDLLSRLKKRDARSNKRRLERGKQARMEDFAAIGRFLMEAGGCPAEEEQAIPFPELLEQCNAWMRVHCFGQVVTRKRLGDALAYFGYRKRRIRFEGQLVQMVMGVQSQPWLMAG